MPVNMLDADGNRVVVADADVPGAVAAGLHLESYDEQASRVGTEIQEEQYGGPAGKTAALGAGALRGLTFGGSDLLLGAIDDDITHDLAGLKHVNPTTSTIGELAGAVVPAIVAPTSLLAKTPAGLIGQAAARGYEGGRAIGGAAGLAKAAAATGAEGAVQGAGAYLSDVALGDRDLTAEGMAGALGAGFALGAGAGGALYGVQGGTIAARRMFARRAEGGEKAATLAEQQWKQQSQSVIEANDAAADAARSKLAEMRAVRERADLARQQARAGYADARAGRVSAPTEAEAKLAAAIDEHDAAKADFDALLAKLEAPSIEPGFVPQTPGVPVGEFGAPGARGYAPGEVRAPGPPSVVAAATGDVTAVGRKRVAEGTPVGGDAVEDIDGVIGNLQRKLDEAEFGSTGYRKLEKEWENAISRKEQLGSSTGFAAAPGAARPAATSVASTKALSDEEFNHYKKEFFKVLSKEESAAGFAYSKGSDQAINGALRRGEKPSEDIAKKIRLLDDALERPESVLQRDVELYRGLSGTWAKERFANISPGEVFEDLGYTSTAAPATSKVRNEDVVFIIHAPAGTKATPIPSNYADTERELLLARGGKFKIHSNEVVPQIPTETRWKDAVSHEVLPDKSIRIKFNDGKESVYPPYRELKVSLINNQGKVGGVARSVVDLNSPIEKLTMKQLADYRELLEAEFSRVKSGAPGYDDLLKKDNAVVARRRDILDGKAPEPSQPWAPPAVATTTPIDIRDLNVRFDPKTRTYHDPADVGRGAPVVAGPAAPIGGDLESQLAAMKQQIDAGSTIGQIGVAKRATPVSPRQLEERYDDIIERAAETSDIAVKQRLLREASEVEEQIAAAGPRSIVHDVADVAPVAARYEQAAAAVAEAAGDSAPQIARDFATAVRKAETAADAKMMDRATRAVDDAVEAPADDLAKARSRKRTAEADYANARAAETEAKIGARAAEQAAKESRAAAAKATEVVSLPGRTVAPRGGFGIAEGLGALELADTIGQGIPGVPRVRDLPVIGPLLSAYLQFRTARAAAGRFVGRVEATGSTRAAVLSARTKDRVAVAVDRSLGLVQRGAPKTRALAANAAVRLPRAFDDGEPDAKKDATLPQVVAVRVREVTAAATNPRAVIAQVRREMRDVHDPDLIAAAEKHRLRAFEYLAGVAPKAPPPNPYTKREWEPNAAAAMKFARQYEAAFDPAAVFEALSQQSLTLEAAETLRATSPKLFAMAQERLATRAGDLDKPVPYEQLLRNSKLFDLPMVPSLEPGSPRILQSTSRAAPRQPAQPQQPPAPSIAGDTNLNQLYQTGLDRRSAAMR